VEEKMNKARVIAMVLFSVIFFLGCAEPNKLVKPNLLDSQFSLEKLTGKTVLILPLRNVSGVESDYIGLEKNFLEIVKDKFGSTKWITPQEVDNMDLDIGPFNAWILFVNKYKSTGKMETKNINKAILEPQKIDYLATVSLMGHQVGLMEPDYGYFASLQLWDAKRESFAYSCDFEGYAEYEDYGESFIDARDKLYNEAFLKMLDEIPYVE
jgi:hypothetical protein